MMGLQGFVWDDPLTACAQTRSIGLDRPVTTESHPVRPPARARALDLALGGLPALSGCPENLGGGGAPPALGKCPKGLDRGSLALLRLFVST